MPLIEVLPNTTNTSAPGWAYVPDTGYDPSKAPIQPSGARQRTARALTLGGDGQEMSAKQNNAVLKRLAELDKDNHRDIHIPIPARQRDGPGRASRGKMTTSVRRILQSQKTFANHLADEEAHIALQGPPTVARPPQTPQPLAKTTARTPAPRGRRPKSMGSASSRKLLQSSPVTAANDSSVTSPLVAVSGPPSATLPDTDDPLLKSYIPPKLSTTELEELLARPPLSYIAARSKPSSLGLPQRRFCEICGYWGRVRCVKCGARVCGLECKGAHDDQRCLKFYA